MKRVTHVHRRINYVTSLVKKRTAQKLRRDRFEQILASRTGGRYCVCVFLPTTINSAILLPSICFVFVLIWKNNIQLSSVLILIIFGFSRYVIAAINKRFLGSFFCLFRALLNTGTERNGTE